MEARGLHVPPEGDAGLPVGLVLSAGLEAHSTVIIRTQSPEYPASPERARPPTVTEVKAWIYLQEQMLSRIECLLKNCILGEND